MLFGGLSTPLLSGQQNKNPIRSMLYSANYAFPRVGIYLVPIVAFGGRDQVIYASTQAGQQRVKWLFCDSCWFILLCFFFVAQMYSAAQEHRLPEDLFRLVQWVREIQVCHEVVGEETSGKFIESSAMMCFIFLVVPFTVYTCNLIIHIKVRIFLASTAI